MSRQGRRILFASGWAGVLGMALAVAPPWTAGGAGLPTALANEEATVAGGLRGVWTAERSKWRVDSGGTATLVELSLRRVGGRGQWNSSETLPLPQLHGLTTAMLEAPSADVRFDWTRDAGKFACLGRFETGLGAGHFSFAANPEYVSDMKRRGYGDIDIEKALRFALHDVSRSFIDELARLGYERVPMDGLISLRIHGASPEFIKGLASLGYRKLSIDQLTSFRIHGASLDFVRDVQSLGYTGLPTDKLVTFRIHGVSPEFIRAFKALGYAQLTPDQLVSMCIHGVSPEFVGELAGLGYKGVEVNDLVSMRIHGVTTDFVRRVQGKSGKGVSVDRLVSMRIHGQTK